MNISKGHKRCCERRGWKVGLSAILTMLAVWIFGAGLASAQNQVPEGEILERPNWRESSLGVDELTRWYRVYIPESLPEEAPVVLLLHGGRQSMRQIFRPWAGGTKEWVDLADTERFLLVVPNGMNMTSGDTAGDHQGWNDGRIVESAGYADVDDVRFIENLLDLIGRDYSIDRTRIYVTGASNGGMMTYRLLAEAPSRFAAGAAFIANLPISSPAFKKPILPTPLMIANGTRDKVVKWEGGEILTGFGMVHSAEETVAWWVDANHARAEDPDSEYLPDDDPADECRVLRTIYPAGKNGAPVVFYRLEGRGHSMPTLRHAKESKGGGCRGIEGARVAWEFLKTHRRSTETTDR